MKWYRIDNHPVADYMFDDFRMEAECQGFTDELECEDYVYNEIKKEFPELNTYFKSNIHESDLEGWLEDHLKIEYDEHELCDDEIKPTYSVYIHISDKMLNYLEFLLPEIYLQYQS